MNPSSKRHFYKMHGAGNDFILIDNRGGHFNSTDQEFIRKLCLAHLGVGADGLMLIASSNKADFKLDYFNSNGMAAEMCGNGARCAVHLANFLQLAPAACSFEIGDIIYKAELRENNHVRLQVKNYKLLMDHDRLEFLLKRGFQSMVWADTGVPHLVAVVKEPLEELDVLQWGRILRHHWLFQPEGTNVNFLAPVEKNHLKVRVYERGVENETLACGTGAVACGIFAAKQFGWQSPVSVHSRGGELTVEFEPDFKKVFLNGPVSMVFEGEFNREYFKIW